MSVTDPLLNESCTDYLNRMLGFSGTPDRVLSNHGAYRRYLAIWDNTWRERTTRLHVDNIASYSLLASGVYRFQLQDGGICLCPKYLVPIAVLNYISDKEKQ